MTGVKWSKWIFGLMTMCLMLLVMATSALAADPKDVPTDHWAYKSVKLLVDKGYLQLYQDQTFQGNQPVDRYTLAVIVAKILNEVASGGTGTNAEDVKALRKLTNELREELVKIIADNNTYSKKAEEIRRKGKVVDEDLISTNLAVQNLSEEQKGLRKEVIQIIEDLKALKEKVTVLENETAQLKNEVAELKAKNKSQQFYLIVAILLGLFGAAK